MFLQLVPGTGKMHLYEHPKVVVLKGSMEGAIIRPFRKAPCT